VTPSTVPLFVGRGDGLTPLGDDVLCGWLAVHRAVGVPTPEVDEVLHDQLSRTTTFSATLLECALAGDVADALGGLLRALGRPGESEARHRLGMVGHSSGAGLAHGADLALAELAASRTAA
jgi:hypothetical protein